MSHAPDYPPGPRGPEEDTPGPLVALTPDQLEYAHDYAQSEKGVSSVHLQVVGAGYLHVRLLDRDGEVIGERRIHPIIGQFKFRKEDD